MKSYLDKIHLFFIRLSKVRLIILFVIINVMNSLLFSTIALFITGSGLTNHSIDKMDQNNKFWMAVILAPFIEMLIFQYALIETIRQKMQQIYVCFISAFAFALVHFYSVYYFLFSLVSGLILAYLYLLEKSVIKGSLLVLTAHILYNLLIYLGRFL